MVRSSCDLTHQPSTIPSSDIAGPPLCPARTSAFVQSQSPPPSVKRPDLTPLVTLDAPVIFVDDCP
eukprot:7383571-Prymnesium_polylepis.1